VDNDIKKILKSPNFNESTISTILGALVILVTVGLIFNFWRTSRQASKPEITPSATSSAQLEQLGEKLVIPENLPSTHTVAKGENLWKIAQNYYSSGYNWVDIAKANNLKKPHLITQGQVLNIPQVPVKTLKLTATQVSQTSPTITSDTYTVIKGDSLWKISVRAYGDGFQWVKIARENNLLKNPGVIYPGTVLRLPR